MISRAQSTTPPKRSAITDDPITPFVFPRNICVTFTALPLNSSATGVAADTPSTLNSVMVFPKEIRRKHLAASAGLTKFFPSPPKQHFTTNIAKKEPMIGI